jgi:hypothetical protein
LGAFGFTEHGGNSMFAAEHPLGNDFFREEPADLRPRLGPEAMIGIAGEFVRLTLPQTEADSVGLLVSFLAGAGALFSGVYGYACGTKHPPTDFYVLVGKSGTGRKGTATNHAVMLMNVVETDFEKLHVIRGLASGEGLIQKMLDRSEKMIVADRRFLALLTEFGLLLEVMCRKGNTLGFCLRDAWDGRPLHVTTRHDSLEIADFQFAGLNNITPSELLKNLDSKELTNGFGNRFLYFTVERSKLLPNGGARIDYSDLAARLRQIVSNARGRGLLVRSEEAERLWEKHYERLSTHPENLKGALCSRNEAHALRLSVLYALLDDADRIEAHHLRAAIALVDYSEACISEIFADRLGDQDAEKIVGAMKSGPVTMTDLVNLFGRNKKGWWIEAKLAEMLKGNLITETTKECDRKTVRAWRLTVKRP